MKTRNKRKPVERPAKKHKKADGIKKRGAGSGRRHEEKAGTGKLGNGENKQHEQITNVDEKITNKDGDQHITDATSFWI